MSNILKLTLICSLIFHVLMGKAAGVGELKTNKRELQADVNTVIHRAGFIAFGFDKDKTGKGDV